MKNQYTLFSRKSRQLKYLLKQLNRGKYSSHSELKHAIRKIRRLFDRLRSALGLTGIRRQLGLASLGFLLSLPLNVGAQSFGPREVNPFGIVDHYSGPLQDAADINGDGLIDLFGGGMLAYWGMFENEIQIYLNSGTVLSPIYNTMETNPYGLEVIDSDLAGFQVVDWDNDGDFDVVYREYYGSTTFFIENIGTPTSPVFVSPATDPSIGDTNEYFRMVDLDLDGDLDMVTGGYYNDIETYENIGTPSSANFVEGFDGINLFAEANEGIDGYAFRTFDFADYDCDADLDLFIRELNWTGDWYFNYYVENTGTPTNPIFGASIIDPYLPIHPESNSGTPVFMDIGLDDDYDMFIGTSGAEIEYYENTTDHPTALDWLLNIIEDQIYIFDFEDFIFNPDYPWPFEGIRIITIPEDGFLRYYGQDVTPYQFIPAGSLSELTFQPVAGETGEDYTSWTYKVMASNGLFSGENYTNTINVNMDVATSEVNNLPNTSIQPNPTDGQLAVNMEFEVLPNQLTIEVRSVEGKLIKTIRPEIHSIITLDVSLADVPSGMYLVRVIADDRSSVHTFVKG